MSEELGQAEIGGLTYDLDLMRSIHVDPINAFKRHGHMIRLKDGRFLCHQDNGGNVLMVAHLDSTMPPKWFDVAKGQGDRRGHNLIFCPTVDDRLGAYVLLDLLPRLLKERDLPPIDILLTEGEETGNTTAAFFNLEEAGKSYHWMGQFDRMASDVVHYQYRHPKWLGALRERFSRVEHGMFSDICWLEQLGCAGANWGTGYHDYTGYRAWADLDELAAMVSGFIDFYAAHHETRFAHEVLPRYERGGDAVLEDGFFLAGSGRCAGDPLPVRAAEADVEGDGPGWLERLGRLTDSEFDSLCVRFYSFELTDKEEEVFLESANTLRTLFQEQALQEISQKEPPEIVQDNEPDKR